MVTVFKKNGEISVFPVDSLTLLNHKVKALAYIIS